MPGMSYSTYSALQAIRTLPEHVQGPARELYFMFESFSIYTLFLWVLSSLGMVVGIWVPIALVKPLSPIIQMIILFGLAIGCYVFSWRAASYLFFGPARKRKAMEIRAKCNDPLYSEALKYLRDNRTIDSQCRSYGIA
jgi:hypothetical protein